MLHTPPANKELIVQLQTWLLDWYGLEVSLTPMAGYVDLNFRATTGSGKQYVLKVNTILDDKTYLFAETEVLLTLRGGGSRPSIYPEVIPRTNGDCLTEVKLPNGQVALIRLLTFLEGTFFAEAPPSSNLDQHLGKFLAQLHQTLQPIDLPAIRARRIEWDLLHALDLQDKVSAIPDPAQRRLAAYFLLQFEVEALPVLKRLPRQLIHNDANDWNLLTQEEEVCGIIDFGDLVYAPRIQDVAVCLAYVMMHRTDPWDAVAHFSTGYEEVLPLTAEEQNILHWLIAARLCTTAIHSAVNRLNGSDTPYTSVSEAAAWKLLDRLHQSNPLEKGNRAKEGLLHKRRQLFSSSMSISYQEPLHMEKAALQYMYSQDGKTYLDCVNNIVHVGHCHPKVVHAARRQLALLNTNTRYLYESLHSYAEQLLGHFPDRLNKVFFVNSGSAAADLALRLARTHTQREAMLVMEHGYHGNTAATIDVSHYKYAGKGGPGRKPWIFEVPLPMVGEQVPEVRLDQWIETPVAGLIAESIVGCGGQVVFPEGYLNKLYQQVHAQGGVCIADEVQTGFGRVGSKFWAYELYGVEPDIVVLGKPMGNGHPLAAVVTSEAIAKSFETGMEFFSSFGGNPVSCVVGKAVLEVIEEEKLQAHAQHVGNWLKKGLEGLKASCASIADVRGAGLFLGLELINGTTGKPDAALAHALVNGLMAQGILLSTDGPHHNVIKIKPPMVFQQRDAERLLQAIKAFLESNPTN